MSWDAVEEAFTRPRVTGAMGAELVDQAGGEALVDRGGTAGDGHLTSSRRRARLVKGGVDAVGDEPEGGAALHRQRVAAGRAGPRPTAPASWDPSGRGPVRRCCGPSRTRRRTRPGRPRPGSRRGVEHPGVQPVHWSVAERLVRCLARTGEVAVGRDRDVAVDLAGHGTPHPRRHRCDSQSVGTLIGPGKRGLGTGWTGWAPGPPALPVWWAACRLLSAVASTMPPCRPC
jgi:hypothetical protein